MRLVLCSVGCFILFLFWVVIFVYCLFDLIVVKRSRFVIDVVFVVLVYCLGWSYYCVLVLSELILDYVCVDNLKKVFFCRGDVVMGKEVILVEIIFFELSIEVFVCCELNDYGIILVIVNLRFNCRWWRFCWFRWWLNFLLLMFFVFCCWLNYWGWELRS